MKLFYREYGKGDPIIILHGLIGSSDNWLPQAKMLGETHHVYVVDQRNHGQSPHSGDFDYKVLSEDIHDFVNQHGIQNPVLIGHSMGGKAAMNFALAYPDMLSKLIIVDIAPKAYEVRHDHVVEGLKAIPIDSVQSRNEADQYLANHVADAGVRQFLLKNLTRKPEGGFTWKLNLSVIDRNMDKISEGLIYSGKFEKETLFIRGLRSDYIIDEDIKVINGIFPRNKVIDLDTGHWVQAEKPIEFVEAVHKFLKSE